MGYNAGDERQVRKVEEQMDAQRKQELEDIKTLLETPAGVRFLRRLMTDTKVFSSCYTGNATTYYLEGRRDLGLKYFADIVEAAPAHLIEVITVEEKKEGEKR